MNKPWTIALTILVTLIPHIAWAQAAQPWLSDRRYTGIGIRAGDIEIHPGIAGELGFDSNYFQSSGDAVLQEPVIPSARIRITPSLSLKTLGPERAANAGAPTLPALAFSTQLSGGINQLFALSGEFAPDDSARTYFDGDFGARLKVLPKRPWSLDLHAAASRVAQPSDNPGVFSALLSRTSVAGGGDVHWRPGGGTLEWSLGYDARLTVYDETDYDLDSFEQGISLKGRWAFLPQTALLYDGRVAFVDYLRSGGRLLDSTPISSMLGINGLITPRLGLLLQGGWKATFFEPDPLGRYDDYDGPIGRAELTWFLAAPDPGARSVGFSNLRLGYLRDVANSGIANYYVIDRVYADLSYAVGGVLLFGLRGGMSFVKHPAPLDADGQALTLDGEDINELRPDAYLSAEYRITSTFAAIANAGYSSSLRDNVIIVNQERNLLDNLQFSRFTALVGARWFL